MNPMGNFFSAATFAAVAACALSSPALAVSPLAPPAISQRAVTVHASTALRSAPYPLVANAAPAIAFSTGVPDWLEQKLVGTDSGYLDFFGSSVAMEGTTAFMSAAQKKIRDQQFQGAVYVFTALDGIWTQTAQLVASDGAAFGGFGWTMALSGTTAIIGTQHGFMNGVQPSGKAYIFTDVDGTWTEQQIIRPSDGVDNDSFSWSIATDGTTALLGAPGNLNGNIPGAVYVFTNTDGIWTQTQKLIADDGMPQDLFGSGVAFNDTTILIGAPDATIGGVAFQGAVYVFKKTDGTWVQTQKLLASDGAKKDGLGYAVALSGSSALVGALYPGSNHIGAAYAFADSGDGWVQTQKLVASDGAPGDMFGGAISMSGNAALVGALQMSNPNDFQGAAYRFTFSNGVWTQRQEFTASDPAYNDEFGRRVALSGTTALIAADEKTVNGNQLEGAVYAYTAPPPVASITPTSLELAVAAGATTSSTLTIANQGGADLTYAFGEADASCSSPADVSWLSEAPANGPVVGDGSLDVTVAVDATTLDPGDYSALLCITANDPVNGLIQMPVDVTVGPNDTIFSDSFDGIP